MISNSREYQDFFILSVLDNKRNGTYIEIGAATPRQDNNTYLLETDFDWTGVSVEWHEYMSREFNQTRRNPCLQLDATKIPYTTLFEHYNMPKHIDYLQLDIDPPANTFRALNNIDFTKYSFGVITYEHDWYAGGDQERIESRRIIESHGYTRVVSDVMHEGVRFEDWYVNEKYMPNDNWKLFRGENIELCPGIADPKYMDLFKKLLKEPK